MFAARMCAPTQISISETRSSEWWCYLEICGPDRLAGGTRLTADVEVVSVQHPNRFIEAQLPYRPRSQRHQNPVDGVNLAGRARLPAAAEGQLAAPEFAVVVGGRVPDHGAAPPGDIAQPVAPTHPTTATEGSVKLPAAARRKLLVEQLRVLVHDHERLEVLQAGGAVQQQVVAGATEPDAACASTTESGSAARLIPGPAQLSPQMFGLIIEHPNAITAAADATLAARPAAGDRRPDRPLYTRALDRDPRHPRRKMIVFASAVTSPTTYDAYAAPGSSLASEPDSRSLPRTAQGSIFSNYNAILDEAATIEGLEALVFLHQDAEITDPEFCAKLRAALADPQAGVVGCVGSIGVRSIAWWEGSVTWASFVHRDTELGGGDVPSRTWNEGAKPPFAHLGEVDTVDGFVLGLSSWVVRNIRFDESLGQMLHGYDFDFCLQVRAAGRKVVTADFKVVDNHSLQLASYSAIGPMPTSRSPKSGTGRCRAWDWGGELAAARAAGKQRPP